MKPIERVLLALGFVLIGSCLMRQLHADVPAAPPVVICEPALEVDGHLHCGRVGVRRIEQTVRWSKEKAEALPSWAGWPAVLAPDAAAPEVSQLLVVRRTRANERIAREFAHQLALAYPAHPEDALAALRGEAAWPGSALVWARIEKDRVRFLPTR